MSTSKAELAVRRAYDGSLINTIKMNSADEVELSIQRASVLFRDTSRWLQPYERIEILERTATLMHEQFDNLVRIALAEGGKPYKDTLVEVTRAIDGVRISAREIAAISGHQVPMGLTKSTLDRMAFSFREPIGVVVAISAFNHPLNLIVHQVVTAFAAGCPVLIKPSLSTPLSCLNLLSLLKDAGLPEDWCQSVICDDHIAENLATDSRINFLSFIGSPQVGWYLRSRLSPGTRCALEHGGVAPVIVDFTADLKKLVPAILKGGFYHAGQVCVSIQKVYIPESMSKVLLSELVRYTTRLTVGDPADEETEVGPLISSSAVDRVDSWVKEAIREGAELLCGGEKLLNNCYAPTILLNPPSDCKVSTQEIFGPVVCVYTYTDRERAIELANSLEYHFQSSVFSQDIDVAVDAVKKLNATSVMVNDHPAFRADWMPFGGRDKSGYGVGGIPYSIREMTREKLVVINSSLGAMSV